jgi:hypothetical protein
MASNEGEDGLSSLNDMIDSWSNENLLINTKVREVFPLVAAQSSYTMGPTGNFNTTRPLKIELALMQDAGTLIETPVEIFTKEQFASISLKTLTSNDPQYIYPTGSYPLETVHVWPVPTEANNLVLYSWKPLATLANLSTEFSLPPGYGRALKYNLALELAPEYGRAVPELVAMIAAESKANIKRMNSKPNYLLVDKSLISNGSGFNWMTGEPS